MTDDIPQWAKWRACELASDPDDEPWSPNHLEMSGLGRAFARYIAAHEEPPADPLLVEAREIAADVRRAQATDEQSMVAGVSRTIREGKWDDHGLVTAAHRALKRGMELARESRP